MQKVFISTCTTSAKVILYAMQRKGWRNVMNTTKETVFMLLLLPLLFFTALAGWRVDFFRVLDAASDETIFSAPAALGHKFTTRYIHSVELTPVEDEYYVVDGKLWSWEERVRSSKAGMPSVKPEYGRYIEDADWMIYQGGRLSWDTFYYRIGNKHLGLNQSTFEPFGRRNFYEIFPGRKLSVSVCRSPFLYSGVYFADRLKDAPEGMPAIEHHTR